MPCQSLRTSLVFLDFAINSFNLSRMILVFNSVPLRFPSIFFTISTFVFVSISSMSSLQYCRYTLIHPSSYVRLSNISVDNFQFLSPRLRQCTLILYFTFNLFSTRFSMLPPPPPCSYPHQSPVVLVHCCGMGTAPGGGGTLVEGHTKGTCRRKLSICTKQNTAGGGLQRMHEE